MIDYEYADLFLKDNTNKQFIIHTDDGKIMITNSEVHSESFELTESICSENTLRFGASEASSVKFRISNVFTSLVGKWITVKCVLDGHTDKPFVFGRYKVYSDKPTADRSYRDIVAYDAMYDILNADVTEWYNSLKFPMPLKTFRNAFISHFNLEEEEVNLPNDEMSLKRKSDIVELSGKTVITAICELNGCFGHVDGNTFKYVFLTEFKEGLYPSTSLYPSEDLFPKEGVGTLISKSTYIPPCKYEDFVVQKISGITLVETASNNKATFGTSNNAYIIQNNFLLHNYTVSQLKSFAEKLLAKVNTISYRPFSTKAKGNPCLQVGDIVRLNTKSQLIESYVLQRTISGIQSLKDNYVTNGTEYYGMKLNSLSRTVSNLATQTNASFMATETKISNLDDRTNAVANDVTELEAKTNTRFTQTDELIEFEANRAKGAESDLSSRIALTATGINLSVKDGQSTASIVVSITREDGTEISQGEIELTGLVTFKSLSESGATEINGSNITTGTISADRLSIPGITLEYGQSLPTIETVQLDAVKADINELTVGPNALFYTSAVGDTLESRWIECNTLYINTGLFDSVEVGEKLAELEARIKALE